MASTATRATSRASSGARRRSRQGAGTRPADAIAHLKAEHREVEELFKRFEGLGPRAYKTQQKTVASIIEALSVHASIEETAFYPLVRERLDDDDEVLEALEEHHLVKTTLAELERMDPEHERYRAKVAVLIENVRHHVREEEDELFPAVRKAFGRAELAEMGDALRSARDGAPERPHPHAPDEPPVNLVANTLSKPVDSAMRAVADTAGKIREKVT